MSVVIQDILKEFFPTKKIMKFEMKLAISLNLYPGPGLNLCWNGKSFSGKTLEL